MKINAQGDIPISHLALLAAVLFNVNKTEEVEMQLDDADGMKKVNARSMGLLAEGEAAVAVIPLHKIMKYAANPYTFKLRVDEGHAILSFEKQVTSPLINTNGAPISTESDVIQKLLEKL